MPVERKFEAVSSHIYQELIRGGEVNVDFPTLGATFPQPLVASVENAPN